MEFIRFYKQKRILHKYVRWMYDLLADGRFYDLEKSKHIKNFPSKYDRSSGKVDYFEKMYNCGSNFSATVDYDTGEHVLHHGYFCGDRVCPVCAIRKSLKEYSKLTWQMNQFKEEYTYYFLTLTLPNNPDGFKLELDLLSKILTELGNYIGFNHRKGEFGFCDGFYGSYEITKSQLGWHPHLHLVLAYPKKYVVSTNTVTKIIKGRERTFENGLLLKCGKRELLLSQDSIMEKYISLIRKYTDLYNERLEDLNFLNIGFQPCYNIEQGVNEMAKYLIDFEALQSADDLFVYIRDSYKKKQRVRRGCFLWSDELQAAHRAWLDEWHLQQNLNFVQSGEAQSAISSVKTECHLSNLYWSYNGYIACRLAEKVITIPFTNIKKVVFYYHRIKISPIFDSSGKFINYHISKLPDLTIRQSGAL